MLALSRISFVQIIFLFTMTIMLSHTAAFSWKSIMRNPTVTRKGFTQFMSTAASGGPFSVKPMSVVEFDKIIKSSSRGKYQIIDVREKDELLASALSGDDVLNLPLSDAANWTARVLKGEVLDKSKPTLCLCKMGGRSMKAATFLGEEVKIPLSVSAGRGP
jgi:rhodanese-related sulfurtransferase